MLTNPIYSRWIPTKELALLYISLCLVWWLQSAASDLKWLTYLEIIVPIQCYYLDLIDQLTASLALWRLVAVEAYRTVLYLIYPSNQLKMAY